jgi:hypothetical protein
MKEKYYLLIKQDPKTGSFDQDSEIASDMVRPYQINQPGSKFGTTRIMQSERSYNTIVRISAEKGDLGEIIERLVRLDSFSIEVSRKPYSGRYLLDLLEQPQGFRGHPQTEEELEDYLADMKDFVRSLTSGGDAREKCQKFLFDAGIADKDGKLREEYQ